MALNDIKWSNERNCRNKMLSRVRKIGRTDEKRMESFGNPNRLCRFCKKSYTLEPKSHEYSEETQKFKKTNNVVDNLLTVL